MYDFLTKQLLQYCAVCPSVMFALPLAFFFVILSYCATEHRSCVGVSWRLQALIAIRLLYPGTPCVW